MSFLKRIFRVGHKHVSIPEDSEYAQWSREQLIERLIKLENDGKRAAEQPLDNYVHKKVRADDHSSYKSKKDKKNIDFSKYNTRFIALRFAYLGWNYNGLAIQKDPTPLPTVEGTILAAMQKCKLVPSITPQEYNFSRCGRTDKGVSAMNQVISLYVRSNLTLEEQLDPQSDSKEIPYVHILNQLLPVDIRVSAVCLRPPKGFDARFSCKYRHYKYLFNENGLDISMMREAAKYFEGEHDFRNYCKLDGSKQITNYKRRIISANILQVEGDMYCFDLIGSAFLWHQVRCMTAILFLIGQGLEDISLVQNLLDVDKYPQKPVYDLASDIPLILYDCKFDDLEWIIPDLSVDKAIKTTKAVDNIELDYKLKATVSNIMKNIIPRATASGKTTINIGDGKGKVTTNYKKVLDRDVMDSVETVNDRFKLRKARKRSS
ncbi:HGL003Wp [Eremothecium sinecaudum]|uniref:HGL003Wp n=1 Tax=Eremothecium sinecaudum TaxID=45286 RepID=A0A109V063_9SACH|nr:HGL003Wp [Eremothecium sinecaudum]AMD22337.1 HGL003Wp [Eremothecium sinecaudum]